MRGDLGRGRDFAHSVAGAFRVLLPSCTNITSHTIPHLYAGMTPSVWYSSCRVSRRGMSSPGGLQDGREGYRKKARESMRRGSRGAGLQDENVTPPLPPISPSAGEQCRATTASAWSCSGV